MDETHLINDEQATLWNGGAGRSWVEAQAALDRMFQPLEDRLVAAVGAAAATRVLDIGCGTGSTTLAVARRLGAKGHCVGIDISEPMITAARHRAEQDGTPARFIRDDAQIHDFGSTRFDMMISRFGVMFFADPVAAFKNLRRAAQDNTSLQLIAWRSPAENSFMTTAERAAAPLLPDLPARRPDSPGQFGFADRHRVQRILDQSGWTRIEITPIDVSCTLPETDLIQYFTRLGPLGRILDTTDTQTRTQLVQTVRAAFDPFVRGPDVNFTAACWMIGTRALSA